MRTLLCLAWITLVIRPSSAADARPVIDDDLQPSSMTLQELLNAYQVLYERQFHEPLPENQKALLATLPRFNGDSTHKARKSVNWARSFQRDAEVNDEDGKELTGLAVIEKREASTEPTATTLIEKTEDTNEPTATTVIEKREIASKGSTEKMSESTAAPSVKSTAARTSAVSNRIAETATMDVTRTTTEEERSSTISSSTSNNPSSTISTTTSSSTSMSSDTNSVPQADPVKTTQTLVQNVQGRKLTDLHPELKHAIEGKVKPVIVQEVSAAPKLTEAQTATESSQATQPQENTSEPTKIVLSKPLAIMPKKEVVELPKIGLTTTIKTTTSEPIRREKLSTAATTNSMLLMGETRPEMKSKMPVMKMTKSTVQPMRTRKMLPSRQNEQNRRGNSGGRVAMVKPMTRQQQQQRQPNLRVIDHVVVPATAQKKMPAQNGHAVQNRRPQMPSRRASLPGRQLPSAVADLKPNTAPRTNLIVIRDGRIVELTEQQQKDLNLILSSSAMGAQNAETPNRRRAPVHRERTLNRRFRQQQPFRRLHA